MSHFYFIPQGYELGSDSEPDSLPITAQYSITEFQELGRLGFLELCQPFAQGKPSYFNDFQIDSSSIGKFKEIAEKKSESLASTPGFSSPASAKLLAMLGDAVAHKAGLGFWCD